MYFSTRRFQIYDIISNECELFYFFVGVTTKNANIERLPSKKKYSCNARVHFGLYLVCDCWRSPYAV